MPSSTVIHSAPTAEAPNARGIAGLSRLDQLIVGAQILFLLVFVMELFLVVPCGGWQSLSKCGVSHTEGTWAPYFVIDPYWGSMPPWYATVMYLQDLLFNPFWAVSLVMFLLHRQDTAWFRTATVVVSSMIIATSTVVFATQVAHPDITASRIVMLLIINGPWAVFPALFIVRMHRAGRVVGE